LHNYYLVDQNMYVCFVNNKFKWKFSLTNQSILVTAANFIKLQIGTYIIMNKNLDD
jgi:hypothetical protein